MRDERDEMDTDIQLIFEEHNRRLAEEPFLRDTLHRLKRRQIQRDLMYKLLVIFSLACCGLLSPFFIRVSVLLSEYIGIGLGSFENPIGFVICSLLLIILTGRKLIFVLVRP